MANLVGVVSLQAICVAHGLVAARALGVTQMACHYVGHGGFDMILEPFRAYSSIYADRTPRFVGHSRIQCSMLKLIRTSHDMRCRCSDSCDAPGANVPKARDGHRDLDEDGGGARCRTQPDDTGRADRALQGGNAAVPAPLSDGLHPPDVCADRPPTVMRR